MRHHTLLLCGCFCFLAISGCRSGDSPVTAVWNAVHDDTGLCLEVTVRNNSRRPVYVPELRDRFGAPFMFCDGDQGLFIFFGIVGVPPYLYDEREPHTYDLAKLAPGEVRRFNVRLGNEIDEDRPYRPAPRNAKAREAHGNAPRLATVSYCNVAVGYFEEAVMTLYLDVLRKDGTSRVDDAADGKCITLFEGVPLPLSSMSPTMLGEAARVQFQTSDDLVAKVSVLTYECMAVSPRFVFPKSVVVRRW